MRERVCGAFLVVVEGHEIVMGAVYDEVKAEVEEQHHHNDDPSGEKIDEQADPITLKPAPCDE